MTLQTRMIGTAAALACCLAITGKPASAADPWPTSLDPSADTHTFLLWENGAPGAQGTGDDDKPTLTLYPVRPGPSGPAPTTAVIIAPGGSYQRLAANHEGRQVANWFNSQGVTAFVLRYRLGPRYHNPIEMQDAQRAIRFVRARAQELGVRPDRVGFMGFSAGGHLASTVATHFDAGNPSAPERIKLSRLRTVLPFIWRCTKQECRQRCMCLRRGSMDWGWLSETWRLGSGVLC